MPNYQRIAVLILRIVGAIWSSFLTIMWVLYLVEMTVGIDVQHYPTHTIVGNIAYIFLGLLIVLVAKPFVRLLSRGLER